MCFCFFNFLHVCRKTIKTLTFSLVPLAPVESALSLPAKSTRLILLTYNNKSILKTGWERRNIHQRKHIPLETALGELSVNPTAHSSDDMTQTASILVIKKDNHHHSSLLRPLNYEPSLSSGPFRMCCPSPCRASSAWRWCWRQHESGCWSRSCWSQPQSWKRKGKPHL